MTKTSDKYTFTHFYSRFKYFVALSDLSSEVWTSEVANDHILFKGLQNLKYPVNEMKLQRMSKTLICSVPSWVFLKLHQILPKFQKN